MGTEIVTPVSSGKGTGGPQRCGTLERQALPEWAGPWSAHRPQVPSSPRLSIQLCQNVIRTRRGQTLRRQDVRAQLGSSFLTGSVMLTCRVTALGEQPQSSPQKCCPSQSRGHHPVPSGEEPQTGRETSRVRCWGQPSTPLGSTLWASTRRTSTLRASVPRVLTPHPLFCVFCWVLWELSLARAEAGSDQIWPVGRPPLGPGTRTITVSPEKPQGQGWARGDLGWVTAQNSADFPHVGQVLRGSHSQEMPGAQGRRVVGVPPTLRWFIWRRVYPRGTWLGLSTRWAGRPAEGLTATSASPSSDPPQLGHSWHVG